MIWCGAVAVYELRTLFPFNEHDFKTPHGSWQCRLAEVSDLRPQNDRLAWYLAFRSGRGGHGEPKKRNLEVLTSAGHLSNNGFGADVESRITEWLNTNEEDGRREWLDY